MIDGPSLATALVECGVTHVVWIPDSELGLWNTALADHPDLHLIRVCREGEAFGVAAGLFLGGKTPIVVIQCTGFFEAGDSMRNIVHDMKLPLFMIVGLRSWHAHQEEKSADSCPKYAEPIMKAWDVPFTLLDRSATATDVANAFREAQREQRAGAIFIGE